MYPRVRLARLFGVAAACLLAVLLPPAGHAGETQSIPRIELASGTRDALPAVDALWQSHALPMRWAASGGRTGVWLRYGFSMTAAPQEGWSILFRRLANGGTVFVNGRMVADIPLDNERRHANWRRPHLVNLPNEYLHAGQNQVLVFTSYGIGVHGIGSIDVGPTAELQPDYGGQFFVSHTLRWISLLLTCLLAIGFAALWFRRRSESLFGLLSLISAFWALRSLDFAFESVPADMRLWTRGAFYVGTAAFAALATITMWRHSGHRRWAAEAGVVVLAALGPLLFAISGDTFDVAAGSVWQAMMLGMLGLGLLVLARHALRTPTFMVKGIVLAIAIALAAAVHDFLVYVGVLPYGSAALLNIATPVLVVALGAALIELFVRSLADVEKTNAELESRIHEREQLLKRNFDRLRESERVKASAQERQRIMQDMHDGLGSQLLSSLMLVERGALTNEQVAQILRESIDDMRLAIDALAAEDSDLLSALGNLRYRMEPRLKAAGMELQWDARGLPEEIDIDPDAVLPVLRIVQEALTNAIKHSRARAVRVSLGVDRRGDAELLTIRVTDNGRGLAAAAGSSGRGLLNMRNRAGKIGAVLKVETVPGAGTMILLRLPLAPSPGPDTRAMQLSLNTEAVIEQVRQG
jgi:signal transduction histidine kinase